MFIGLFNLRELTLYTTYTCIIVLLSIIAHDHSLDWFRVSYPLFQCSDYSCCDHRIVFRKFGMSIPSLRLDDLGTGQPLSRLSEIEY